MNKHQAKPPLRPIAIGGKRLAAGFDNLSFEQIVMLWRLTRGGIADNAAVQRIVGVKVHAQTCKAAIGLLDRALTEQLALAGKVRCRGCGGLITSVPCLQCGRDSYRVSER